MSASSPRPEHVEIIGGFLAIRWSDGREDALPAALLREKSPSAENVGERDLMGRRIGGEEPRDHSGVGLVSWQPVGGYALALAFTDGHRSGIFPYRFLRELGD